MTSLVEEKVSPTKSCNSKTNTEAVLPIVVYVDSDFWFTLYIMGPLFFVMDFLRLYDKIRQHEICPIICVAHLQYPFRL
jgi:hypothetical protein